MDVLVARRHVETSSRSPASASSGAPLREDAGPPIALARPIAAFAPSVRDGFFLVPRLSTHEDDDA